MWLNRLGRSPWHKRAHQNIPGRWRKVGEQRTFLLELRPNGVAIEALADAPHDTWEGTWELPEFNEFNFPEPDDDLEFYLRIGHIQAQYIEDRATGRYLTREGFRRSITGVQDIGVPFTLYRIN
ncbi:hypothetical protein C6Y44_09710 [Rhodococcus rhodochrous]|nr:hypothetical protein C6Y44_09710 [Rhodococcus rhodochrous]